MGLPESGLFRRKKRRGGGGVWGHVAAIVGRKWWLALISGKGLAGEGKRSK